MLIIKFILISLFFLNLGCSINPATGTPDIVLMSESSEIAMGKEMHEKLIKSMPIYQDKKLTEYVNSIGQKIVKNSHRTDIEYHFTIIDAPDINAFALPGGYIYINRGLLSYLHSEAQLAAVLAHEVGHVTARHVVRQDSARKGASVLSVLSIFTTGSAAIGDVTNLLGTAAVKGYGREMELEADGLGADYLLSSGYDPHAMVETIGVLKDQEKFARYRAKEEGKKTKSYHGVFATHPRNDIRLKEVISKAGSLQSSDNKNINEQVYREKTEGMIYGVNYSALLKKQPVEKNRYIHEKLGFSLLFPMDWKVKNTRKSIIIEPENKSAKIQLRVSKRLKGISPGKHLRNQTKVIILKRSEDFKQNGLVGHTGIIEGINGDNDQRVATIFQGGRAYTIISQVNNPDPKVDYDSLFLKSIHSFKPHRVQNTNKKSKVIHYVKANDQTKFSLLAKQLKIGLYGEQQLRLINGQYPRGEPLPGQWIKIIK
ncbi:peptidase M48 [Pseudoalteromonas sp. NBT06-2]|nr:peptidase M48 [Pseudoalteromonas sp. NBT06-2]